MPWAQVFFARTVQAADCPQLCWMHEAASGRHWLEKWPRLVPPDLALCNSYYTAATIPRLYPSVAYEVMYPPVKLPSACRDTARRGTLRKEFATTAEAIVIVQVSRLQPLKGQQVHLEALGRMRAQPGWVCWFVGGVQQRADAHYLAALKHRASALGIADRLRFCGECFDVPELLGAADIFCQPNVRAEAFGIAVIEALLRVYRW